MIFRIMTGPLLALCLGALAFVVASMATAGDDDGAPQTETGLRLNSPLKLPDIEAFRDFPLYFLGSDFEGLPLVYIVRADEPRHKDDVFRSNFVGFVYGSSQPCEGDSGCAPPLQVQVWPACERNLSKFKMNGNPLADASDETAVRGVPAIAHPGGSTLEIYTGEVTIVIFGSPEQVMRAARALRSPNTPVTAEVDFPAPASGSLDGELDCAEAEPQPLAD